MGAIVMAGDPGFWDVAWNWPLPFVTVVAMLAVPMAGIIWFVCQLRYKQQIATLKDRVELADERLGDAKESPVKNFQPTERESFFGGFVDLRLQGFRV
jgi:hypothetical protein